MNNSKLISSAHKIVKAIVEIQQEHYNRRKEKKENFNFFSAIVSGKNSKEHLEKYHSNFIAFLLNPNESHDFDDLFLKHFFRLLKEERFEISNLPENETLIIERERQTTGGRFIDISLEHKKDWIIFIENKIGSGELQDQVKDYCDFAMNYSNRIGIYLTLNGEDPTSIDKKTSFNKGVPLICLSYEDIINWIECCCNDLEVQQHQHIISALKQYILIIKNLLKVMKDDTKAIIAYLKQNKTATSEIVSNFKNFRDSIIELIKEVRDHFYFDLDAEVKNRIKNEPNFPETLKIEIQQGDYLFSGDLENSFGLGFAIKKEDAWFNYGGEGFGGGGNAVFINGISAHYGDGIDKTNGILISAYEVTEEWKKILKSAADKIMEEVMCDIIPKFNT